MQSLGAGPTVVLAADGAPPLAADDPFRAFFDQTARKATAARWAKLTPGEYVEELVRLLDSPDASTRCQALS